jgi:predicted kinase
MSTPRIQKISLNFNQIELLINSDDSLAALLQMAENDNGGVVYHAIAKAYDSKKNITLAAKYYALSAKKKFNDGIYCLQRLAAEGCLNADKNASDANLELFWIHKEGIPGLDIEIKPDIKRACEYIYKSNHKNTISILKNLLKESTDNDEMAAIHYTLGLIYKYKRCDTDQLDDITRSKRMTDNFGKAASFGSEFALQEIRLLASIDNRYARYVLAEFTLSLIYRDDNPTLMPEMLDYFYEVALENSTDELGVLSLNRITEFAGANNTYAKDRIVALKNYSTNNPPVITNPLIFFMGNASDEEKTIYLTTIFKKTNNTVCLNIDSLIDTFNLPLETEFTTSYNYDDRIKNPAHKAVLNLAEENLLLGKQVILTGNFDDKLTANCIKNFFPNLKKKPIRILYLNKLTSPEANYVEIEALADKTLHFTTAFTSETHIETLMRFLANSTTTEEILNSKPILALSAGLAGVGKTTSCTSTSKSYSPSVFLQKDSIGLTFLNSVNQDMTGPYYSTHVKDQTYKALFSLAQNNLKLNRSAIVDGWFGDKLSCSWMQPHLGATAYITTLIYFHCSEPTELARVQARGALRDETKLRIFSDQRKSDLEKHLQNFSQVTYPGSVLFVDTDDNVSLKVNVTKITAHFHSPVMSLQINPRNQLNCHITAQEAGGNIDAFKQALARSSITGWQSFWTAKNPVEAVVDERKTESSTMTFS